MVKRKDVVVGQWYTEVARMIVEKTGGTYEDDKIIAWAATVEDAKKICREFNKLFELKKVLPA